MTATASASAAYRRAMSRSVSPFYGPDLPLRTCAHCRRLFRAVSRTETCCSLTCADARGSTMSPLPVTNAGLDLDRMLYWRAVARRERGGLS
jgi:hypothetical protein